MNDNWVTSEAKNLDTGIEAIIFRAFHKTGDTFPAEMEYTFHWVLDSIHASSRFLSLPMLTYRATQPNCLEDATQDLDRMTTVAAAWHLLHCAARLLDDVEDGEAENPVPELSPAIAINSGTALIFIAQLILASLHDSTLGPQRVLDLIVVFNLATARMANGQTSDLALNASTSPTLELIHRIAGLKSGEFFALACRAGALLSNAGSSEVATCADFGYNLGILVQISDDFRALWAPNRRGDLTTAHRTLPIAYALSVADPVTAHQIRTWLAQAPNDQDILFELQALLADLGALHYTVLEAGLYHARAREALLRLPRPNQAQYALLALLDTVFPAIARDQWPSPRLTTPSFDSSNGLVR